MPDLSDPDSLRHNYRADGVVCVKQALSPETLTRAEEAFSWNIKNPGPGASEFSPADAGQFYQDLANPASFEAYQSLLAAPEFQQLISTIWGKPDVWFMYEQVFQKSGGVTRRTPWHQDSPYLPVDGDDLAVMWISFDSLTKEQSLEFVRGSHKGVMYDGSRFSPKDDTAPLFGDGSLPRLPDIEADRASWPIVSYAVEPGDVLIFHPGVLHGGAATDNKLNRRTLSLRFFGDDAVVGERPQLPRKKSVIDSLDNSKQGNFDLNSPSVHPLTRQKTKPPGTPFRDPQFPKL